MNQQATVPAQISQPARPVPVPVTRHTTEQICLVCKGKRKVKKKATIWMTILVFTPVILIVGGIFGTGPIALLILIALYIHAFRGKSCTVCKGHGKVPIQVSSK
ncbi:hypothetical protein [Paenibacillus alkaliterrae]|uniref:hypothetical protein n=1 Tax=Paenibacillus alkaliterrae TaxID=320909 RepID=UPI0039EE5D4E